MQRCQRFYIRACLILLILGMSCSELEEEGDLTEDLKLRRRDLPLPLLAPAAGSVVPPLLLTFPPSVGG
jgi:hypothetical protein